MQLVHSDTSIELADVVEEPATQIRLPRQLDINGQTYRLLGFGPRSVTFLSIKVYVVGLYVPANLQIDHQTPPVSLAQTVPALLYIAPTRGTGAAHLRDGFVRSLTAYMKQLPVEGMSPEIVADQQQHMLTDIDAFKALFPKANIAKGAVLLLEQTTKGLRLTFDGNQS